MNNFAAFVAFILLASAHGMSVEGPGDHWIRNGGSQTLSCRSESKISTCSWETPYKALYTFGAAKAADGGRIKHISGDENQCSITIEPLGTKDEGSWTCHVGTVNSQGELETGVGSGRLNIAAEPLEVVIERSDMKMNDSMGNNTEFLKINCVVKGAKPEPSFTWFLEEELMENPEVETEQFEDDWIQTLILSPEDFNGSASLKCSVNHLGLAEPLEVDTIIGMNLDVPSKKLVTNDAPIPLKYIAFIPLILVFFIPVHLYAYRREHREFFNTHCAKFFTRGSGPAEEDLEKGENGDKEEEKEVADEKKDEEKPDPEVKEEEEVEDKKSAWKKLKGWMAPKQLKEKKLSEEKNPEDLKEEIGEDTVDEKKEETAEEAKAEVEEEAKEEKVEEEKVEEPVPEEKKADESPSS